jgi:hypothetical protein
VPVLQDVSLLSHGQDILHGEAETIFSQTEALREAGLKAPLAAQIAAVLRRKGWPLSVPIASMKTLSASLENLVQGGWHE